MKNNLISIIKGSVIIIAILILNSCEQNDNSLEPEIPSASRGDIIGEPDYKYQIDNELIKAALSVRDDVDINIIGDYSISVYSLEYNTIDKEGNLVPASGAIFLPITEDSLSVLSYHHGTEFHKNNTASQNPIGNSIESLVAASLGYITFVPDYLGLGVSNQMHPYHIEEISASAVIDFLIAGNTFCDSAKVARNGKLFLAGYSEGGYVTLAVQKEVEINYSNRFRITASAPLAGAFDLYSTAVEVLNKNTVKYPSFISYIIASYNDYYNWDNLNYYFSEKYYSEIPDLFNGYKDIDEIENRLTDTLSTLLSSQFLNDFPNGTAKQLSNALKENSLLNWVPEAPIFFCHGTKDSTVYYFNSENAFQAFQNNGADVTLLPLMGLNHRSSVMPAVIATINFFEKYKQD